MMGSRNRTTVRRVSGRRRGVIALAGIVGLLAVASLSASIAASSGVAAAADACPWMDTSLTPDQRARLLLDASTLDQKIRWLDEQSANNPSQTAFSGGITMPAQVACTPVIQYSDGPANVAGAGTGITVFPTPIALAASWDEALARAKGKAQADETWHKGRNVLLAPGLSSGRDPRLGRTPEYLGEDPVLTGLMAAAGVRGFGDNPGEPVESVLKHYVANEQELDRQSSSSNIDPRTLREIYTLPFEIAVENSPVGGVMCSYNDVNNIPACGNPDTLTEILRNEIGFQGWVVTDFGARHSLTAATPSLAAGLDQELNRWRFWTPDAIKAAIAAGTVTEAMVDQAAFRVVRAHIKAGLFDTPKPTAPADVVTTPEHQAVAANVGAEGAVLLKNAGILPLSAAGKKIAVIGQTASNTATGGISAGSVCGYTGPSAVACTPEAPLDSITAWATANGGTVLYNNGADPAAAAATAAAADVAIVFGYYREGEGADRTTLNLDGNGDALIDSVATANPNTVVVLQTGGAVVMPWLDKVKGVLEVWYAGQKMGSVVTNLISGATNPSGKLPITFPKSLADVPTAGSPAQYPGIFQSTGTSTPPNPRNGEIRQVDYSEGLKVGYRWYDSQGIAPLFPFGYGLSYTQFRYSNLRVTPAASPTTVSFDVTNTGAVEGDEVAQLYIGAPASPPVEMAPQLLGGFARVSLDPGQTKHVTISIQPRILQYWGVVDNAWVPVWGDRTFSVGASSRDVRLSTVSGCLHGNVTGGTTVEAGQQVCLGSGARVTGPLTVDAGGSLNLDGATVTGHVKVSGAGVVRVCGTRITGPLTITGSTGLVLVGGDAATGPCAGNTITGPVRITGNTHGVEFNANRVTGSVTITGNTGAVPPPDSGSVHESGNTIVGPRSIQTS
jgi:beta-glucosidase